jgi:hypothetical protein
MRSSRRHLLISLLCATTAACASGIKAPEKILETRNYNASFTCEGGPPMQVHFSPYNALLEYQGVSVAMTQQPAADGFSYAGGGQSLRGKGYEAMWTDDKGAVHHCRDVVANPKTDTTAR